MELQSLRDVLQEQAPRGLEVALNWDVELVVLPEVGSAAQVRGCWSLKWSGLCKAPHSLNFPPLSELLGRYSDVPAGNRLLAKHVLNFFEWEIHD